MLVLAQFVSARPSQPVRSPPPDMERPLKTARFGGILQIGAGLRVRKLATKRHFGFLSPRADFGVSFYGAFSSVTTKWLHRLLLGRSSLNKSPNSLRIYRSAEHDSARGFDNCRASAESPREKEHRPLGHRPQFPSAFRLPPSASRLTAFTRSIFHFQPVTGSPRAIRRVLPLRHHAFETQRAGGWDYFERALKFSLGDGVFAAHRGDTRDHPSSPRCVGVHFSE